MAKGDKKRGPRANNGGHNKQKNKAARAKAVASSSTFILLSQDDRGASGDKGQQKQEPAQIIISKGGWFADHGLEIAIVIAGFIQAGVLFYELSVMRDQFGAMSDQNVQVTRQSELMESQLSAMREQNTNMRDQLKLTEKTTQIQLRAWVGIDNATITWDEAAQEATVIFYVKNYGQTPAYNVSSILSFINPNSPTNQGQPYAINPDRFSETISGSGNVTPHVGKVKITTIDKKNLDSGALQLTIFGTLDYEDVFKKNRGLVFQASWGGKLGTKNVTWDYQEDDDDFVPGDAPKLPDNPSPVQPPANK
jgi:hypothetical protein